MSGTKEEDYKDFQKHVENGPQTGDYVPGSPSENYQPTTIITPATSIGQPGDLFSYEVLTDDETRPQNEDTDS
jgi:hypothetical protein